MYNAGSMQELHSLSQSSIQDYVDCPRRFQLRHIERLSYPAVESEPALENELHQQEGEYFHRLVQQYWLGVPADQIIRLANSDNLRRWWENFTNSTELAGLKNISDLFPETTLSAPLGKFRLVAKYDLIANLENKITIYDWKTYRKRPRNEWLAARMQTRIYNALLIRAGAHLNNNGDILPDQVSMVYWFANFPDEPAVFNYSSAQYKRDWDALVKWGKEIETASSHPKTDDREKCNYCPYRSYCDRGIQAGKMENAEAEMEAEELFNVNYEQIGEIEF